jgi:nucleoid-associated protein YgaU
MKTIAALAFLLATGAVAEAQTRVACPVGSTCTAYRVKPGDTLSEITRDVLGSKNWTPVFEDNRRRFISNKGKRKSPHLIYPGQVIVLIR